MYSFVNSFKYTCFIVSFHINFHDCFAYCDVSASTRLELSGSTSSRSISALGCTSLRRGTAWTFAEALALRPFNSSSPAFVFSKSSWKFLPYHFNRMHVYIQLGYSNLVIYKPRSAPYQSS